MVNPLRFELRTPWLKVRCSNQLSYGSMVGRCRIELLPVKERFYRPLARTTSFTSPLVVLGRIELPSNDYQSLALPLSYSTVLVARTGFEPVISALKGQCPWPLDERAIKKPPSIATGGCLKHVCISTLCHTNLQNGHAIFTAFHNAFNKLMFCCDHHWKSYFLCLY